MPAVTVRGEKDQLQLEHAPVFEKKVRQKKQGFAKVDMKRKKRKQDYRKGAK